MKDWLAYLAAALLLGGIFLGQRLWAALLILVFSAFSLALLAGACWLISRL